VRAATSLTCSLGVAPCKVVAKVGSDARKPGGLLIVVPGQEARFLAPFDVRRLPGVGPKAEARLRPAGIETVGALAALGDADLRRLLPGSVGRVLRDRARGIDPRGLELDAERISISVENTFERDLVERERLHEELRTMALEVAERLQKTGQTARTVTAKLRYADFSIRSRSSSLDVGIDDAEQIADLACRLLDRGLHDRPGALRLVGVGVSGLAEYRQLALDRVWTRSVSGSVSRASGASAAACSGCASRVASTRKPPASDAASTPTPHQRPDRLSATPSAWSTEKRPGPIAATETATVKIRRLYS